MDTGAATGPLEELLLRCDAVGASDQLVTVAETYVDLAANGSAIEELPLLTQASVELLHLQARAYALWSERVADVDALLRRDLRMLAEALESVATIAERARIAATELVESGDLDA